MARCAPCSAALRSQPDFFALLDEATALEAEHGRCVPDLPIPPVAMATKALLSHREGHAAHVSLAERNSFSASGVTAHCSTAGCHVCGRGA